MIEFNFSIAQSFTLGLALSLASGIHAQNVVNGDFENGATGWSGCVHEFSTANVYGGPSSSQHVAEVDGNGTSGNTSDDPVLCQSITGFVVGDHYILSIDATRRDSPSTDATVSVTANIDGDALNTVITRSGGWSMVREDIPFTAKQATQYLLIYANFTNSYGMIIDNVMITHVVPLPVELLAFNATMDEHVVRLDWSTASESNSHHYDVERSPDVRIWSTIATLAAAGSSEQVLKYMSVDDAPLQGTSYYRLREVDADGAEQFSDTKAVHQAGGQNGVWPNPAVRDVSFRLDDGSVPAVLVNAQGQVMHAEQRINGTTATLSIGALPSGIYFVQDGDGSSIGNFIKE